MIGYFVLVLMCFFALIWGNFHIRFIYPICGINKNGSWKKKKLYYKNRFNFFERLFLVFLLTKDNKHYVWFRIYHILHFMEWLVVVLLIFNYMFRNFSINLFEHITVVLFLFFSTLTLTTISIALKLPHMD